MFLLFTSWPFVPVKISFYFYAVSKIEINECCGEMGKPEYNKPTQNTDADSRAAQSERMKHDRTAWKIRKKKKNVLKQKINE